VGNGDIAVYFESKVYFTKKGLTKRTIMHEFYHHLVEAEGLQMPLRIEEKEANAFSREF
jgi:hypothetical protein